MVHQKIRFRILHRDNFTCQYCGRRAPEVVLEVDHIVPLSKGGKDDDENLTTSCRECNRGKFNHEIIPVYEFIEYPLYSELIEVLDNQLSIISNIKTLESELLNLYLKQRDLKRYETELKLKLLKSKENEISKEFWVKDQERLSNATKSVIVLLLDLESQNVTHSFI
ncbi:MAG: HNH endonuclease [Methanobacterium sp.]